MRGSYWSIRIATYLVTAEVLAGELGPQRSPNPNQTGLLFEICHLRQSMVPTRKGGSVGLRELRPPHRLPQAGHIRIQRAALFQQSWAIWPSSPILSTIDARRPLAAHEQGEGMFFSPHRSPGVRLFSQFRLLASSTQDDWPHSNATNFAGEPISLLQRRVTDDASNPSHLYGQQKLNKCQDTHAKVCKGC